MLLVSFKYLNEKTVWQQLYLTHDTVSIHMSAIISSLHVIPNRYVKHLKWERIIQSLRPIEFHATIAFNQNNAETIVPN